MNDKPPVIETSAWKQPQQTVSSSTNGPSWGWMLFFVAMVTGLGWYFWTKDTGPVDVRTACARQFSSPYEIDECAKKVIRRQRDEAVARSNAERQQRQVDEILDHNARIDRAVRDSR
jgi:hypothetical protein